MEKNEQQLAQEKAEQERQDGLKNLLREYQGSPSVAQIDEWKAVHGEVMMSAMSETELFIFRPLRRFEYRQMQEQATKMQGEGQAFDQGKYEEMLCDVCVLWKSVDTLWEKAKAGTLATLTEQIHQNSNFYSPAAASMLVVKL